jgi:hypothetical protein
MRLHPAVSLGSLALLSLSASPIHAQGRIIDQGTFAITRAGASQTENFRIVRGDNGLIQAGATSVSGTHRVESMLTADSLGTPVKYRVTVRDKGAADDSVNAIGGGGRLTATASGRHGDESMREYPLAAGQSMLLEDGLLHQLYFAALGRRAGSVQLIDLRAGRSVAATLTAVGLDPVDVGGKSVTATRYSLVSGAVRRDFWIDQAGRLLRIEIPSQQLVAAREELPR